MRAVLTFHSIDDLPGPLSYSPAGLEAMLDALDEAKIAGPQLDELLGGSDAHGVALTFDDGISTVFNAAMPILANRQTPAHVFVITKSGRPATIAGQVSRPNATPFKLMDWDQLERLQASGFRIEAHTASHPDLRTLTDARDRGGNGRSRRDDRRRGLAGVRAISLIHMALMTRACARLRQSGTQAASRQSWIMSAPRPSWTRSRASMRTICVRRDFVRALPGKRAQAYIALRRALRRLRGH